MCAKALNCFIYFYKKEREVYDKSKKTDPYSVECCLNCQYVCPFGICCNIQIQQSESGSANNWGLDSTYCEGAFEGCVKLFSITLGSGIISIGQDTFAGTQITTLTVPAKVSTLAEGAFAGATKLKDIYFTGNWASNVGGRLFENIAAG